MRWDFGPEIHRSVRDDFADLDDVHPNSLQQLREWLIAPLTSRLRTPALTIVPHGVLHYLPFAVLSAISAMTT